MMKYGNISKPESITNIALVFNSVLVFVNSMLETSNICSLQHIH